MKKNLQTLSMPAAIAASFLIGCSGPRITARTDPNRPSIVQTQEGYDTFGRRWSDQTNPTVLTRNVSTLQRFTGAITDIDYSTREVTLQDSQGRLATFVVDKSVPRLNQARVGDKVSVDYYLGMNAEVRKPTAEEEQNPLVVLQPTGRAGPEPSVQQIRAVVTIEGLDRPSQTVTVKGPRGKYFIARVADPSRLEQVHIGETIVLTFTESAAISMQPVGTGTSTAN